MIFTQPLSFITEFVEELDQGIRKWAPNRKLSTVQRYLVELLPDGDPAVQSSVLGGV